MKLRTFVRAAAAALAIQFAAAAPAATLIVDGTGELTGATGVDVGGTFYDVEFLDGTCVSVFSGCDSDSDFAFNTQAAAQAAGQALLDQVFIGIYDTSPELTAGCEDPLVCRPNIPYDFIPIFTFPPAPLAPGVASRGPLNGATIDGQHGTAFTTDVDLTQIAFFTWARFTPAQTVVPEPSSWAMMLLGFGAVGFAMRRSKPASSKLAGRT
jgi:PEP-CTERM motif-containing protein